MTAPGCWCPGRPGFQPTAQGPSLDKWDKWPRQAGENPGLVSDESSWHRQKTSLSLPAGCLGASTDSSARLFFQRKHCTIFTWQWASAAKSVRARMLSWSFPNILRDPKPILLTWFLRCCVKLLAISWDPRNKMLIRGLSSSSLSGKHFLESDRFFPHSRVYLGPFLSVFQLTLSFTLCLLLCNCVTCDFGK